MPSTNTREIDHLKQRLAELEAENRKLRNDTLIKPVFDQAPLGIFRTDFEGKFLIVNQTLCDMLGYEDPEDLYNNVHNLAEDVYEKPEYRSEILKQLREVNLISRREMNFKKKNDDKLVAMVSAKIIRDSYGKPIYIEGTAEDITEYKKVEEEKRAVQSLHTTLINAMADAVIIFDRTGNIEYVSPQINFIDKERLAEEYLGTNILDYFEVKNHDKVKENVKNIRSNRPYNYDEYEFKLKNGATCYVEVRTTALRDEEGNAEKFVAIMRDVTFHKKSEEILRESQELYRTIIELSPEGIMIIKNDEVLFSNKSMTKILDYPEPWDIFGKSFKKYIKEEYKKEVEDLFRKVEDGGKHNMMNQIQVITNSDEVRDVYIFASPINFGGEKCSFVFVSDQTESIKLEKELKREKHLMDVFWDHLPDSITFKDRAGKFIKVNEEFVKQTGVKDDRELLGKTDKDIFGKEHYQLSHEEESKVIDEGKMIINEVRQENWPRDKNRWVMLTKMPLYDIDKNIAGIFSFSRDITEVKNSELEISKRERQFRWIFDHSPVGKIITDKNFKILQSNDAFCKLVKLDNFKVIRKNVFSFLPKTTQELIKENLLTLSRNNGVTFQSQGQLINSQKEVHHVIIQGVLLEEGNYEHGQYLIQFVDIQSQKKAEEELTTRNAELNNFVYKVSHDLRAPLASVKGLINLMRMEDDPKVYNEYVDMISGRIERLDEFIHDVLSHSKNLNVDIKIEKVNLREIIEECLNYVRYNPIVHRIEHEIKVKGLEFYTDGHRLHEILRNLIVNAYQYSRKEVENPFVRIIASIGRKNCRIIVEDNGQGIKKEYQGKIFNMFFRANEKVEGSGIGLYIVKQSVDKLGGTISLDSEYNKGTKVILNIPNRIGSSSSKE